jgi:2-dehydropantoate 2-reductase
VVVGVVGAGALGTIFGVSLGAQTQVRVLTRDRAAAEAIERRAQLAPSGALQLTTATHDASSFDDVEIVIVAVKANQTVSALRPLRDVLRRETTIVSIQNGILAVRHIGEALGETRPVVLGPTTEGGIVLGPGTVRRIGSGMTTLGWARGRGSGDLAPLRDLLIASGLHARVAAPIEPHVWAKLIANAAINPLTAIAGVPNGGVAEDPELRERAAAIAREAAAVAAAHDVTLPYDDPVAHVFTVARATAENRSSMLQDLERGRPTEIDAINGAIAELGRTLGIPTPHNDRALDEVRRRTNA